MSESPSSTGRSATGASTRATTTDVILDAAFRILARDGYQGLTARSVAEEAGTNLALVNYHFGGKKGLLLALYDELERQRFARQQAMYDHPSEPLSAKWRRALAYYRSDLQDGFVRVHHELQAQGFADQELAERGRQRVSAWGELLTEVAGRYLPELGVDMPTREVVAAFCAFWFGMEQLHLIGMDEAAMPYDAVLKRIGAWIEEREASTQAAQFEAEPVG
ncbi:MAG: TetR/AcrR family transcriptional regulator [Trueperaceae bacterium]